MRSVFLTALVAALALGLVACEEEEKEGATPSPTPMAIETPSPAAPASPALALSAEEREAGERFLDNLTSLLIEMTEDDVADQGYMDAMPGLEALESDEAWEEAASGSPVVALIYDNGKACRTLIWGESRLLRPACDDYDAILQKASDLNMPLHQVAAHLAPVAREVREILASH
jgi:hypothetical protein